MIWDGNEDLEGIIRLKRMWNWFHRWGKRGTNGWRWAVILNLGSFTRRGLMWDKKKGDGTRTLQKQSTERAEGATPGERWKMGSQPVWWKSSGPCPTAMCVNVNDVKNLCISQNPGGRDVKWGHQSTGEDSTRGSDIQRPCSLRSSDLSYGLPLDVCFNCFIDLWNIGWCLRDNLLSN